MLSFATSPETVFAATFAATNLVEPWRKSIVESKTRPFAGRIFPCFWVLSICFLIAGLFGIVSMFVRPGRVAAGAGMVVLLPWFALLTLAGSAGVFSEWRYLRKRVPKPAVYRRANPWKVLCTSLLSSGIDGVLRPLRGPLTPSETRCFVRSLFRPAGRAVEPSVATMEV